MLAPILALISLTVVVYAQHGAEAAKEMGPAAFMWPPDRLWGADQDNTAPCGSASGAANRTEFPLVGGKISLVMQDDSYTVRVAISNKNDPKTNDDFEVVIDGARISELDPGHDCFAIPDPAASIAAGSNATLQLQYSSDFDSPGRNDTFYACADIRYVLPQNFRTNVPCFNTTGISLSNTTSSSNSSAAASSAAAAAAAGNAGGSGTPSGGTIAGIVIGAVAGLALIAGAPLLWRRKQQQKRAAAINQSGRHVAWDGSGDTRKQSSSSKDTGSSIQMQPVETGSSPATGK